MLQEQTALSRQKAEEKLIPSRPRLKNIYKILGLMEGYVEWKEDVLQRIGPWKDSLQLFDNVQKAVREQVKDKIIAFRNKVPSISKISDTDIVDAIVNNWPEAIPEIQGQRREVLLCAAAHVVRHMETSAYKKIIASASEKQLKKIGLSVALRVVTIKVLTASIRADNLFIRFLAFTHFPLKLPKVKRLEDLRASYSRFYLPRDKKIHTINELFPGDTQYISLKFREIANMPFNWENIPGGETFKRYLVALSNAYQEKNINKIDQSYKKVSELFGELASSPFPILVIPPGYFECGYEKAPYHDPELRVGLSSSDCVEIEKDILHKQRAMAKILKDEGYVDLSQALNNRRVKVINSIGDYGVNLKSKATGQSGDSVVITYLGEQAKAFKGMREGKNFQVGSIKGKKSQRMSFYCNLFHELSHLHVDDESPAIKRLGQDSSVIIQEAEAEQLYRWFIPKMIDMGKLEGTKEEWAAALVENSLIEIMDKSENGDPEYYYSSVFTLNRLLSEQIVKFDFENRNVSIENIDDFYRIQEEQAKEVLSLFEDKSMNKEKASKWIKEKCAPNKIIKKVSKIIKK